MHPEKRVRQAPLHRTRAFTLLELLVVVSIIGLLIAIIVPGLASARRAGRRVQCAANLRQVGLGWTIYAQLNNGCIVPGRPAKFADPARNVYWVGNGYQYRPRWFVTMGAESGFYAFARPSVDSADDNRLLADGHKVFQCPEVPDRLNNRNYPYGYNFQFLGNTRFLGNAEANGFIHFPVKVENLSTPQTVMAADALGTAAGKPRTARTPYRIDGGSDLYAVSNHGWALDPPRLTPTSDYCDDANRAPEHRSAPDLRHHRLANVLWCDVHVEAQTYGTLGYVESDDGSVAALDPAASNRFFSGTGRNDDPPRITTVVLK